MRNEHETAFDGRIEAIIREVNGFHYEDGGGPNKETFRQEEAALHDLLAKHGSGIHSSVIREGMDRLREDGWNSHDPNGKPDYNAEEVMEALDKVLKQRGVALEGRFGKSELPKDRGRG